MRQRLVNLFLGILFNLFCSSVASAILLSEQVKLNSDDISIHFTNSFTNRRTGDTMMTVRVTNVGNNAIDAPYYVSFWNLNPVNVTIRNAHGLSDEGIRYFRVGDTLPPGASKNINILFGNENGVRLPRFTVDTIIHVGGGNVNPTPPLPNTLNISISLPEDIIFGDIVVASKTSIDIGSNTRLDGALGSQSGSVILRDEAYVGKTVVGGDAQLKNGVQVNGDLRSAGEISLKRDSSVSGIIEDHAKIVQQAVTWSAEVPSTSAGNVVLEPRELRDLPPGRYGIVTMTPGSQLVVHSGAYAFEKLIIQPDSTLIVDDTEGAVQLHVGGTFIYTGRIQPTLLNRSPQLVIVYHGTRLMQMHTAFKGVFVAPSAEVVINSGSKEGGHEAMFYGKQVLVQPKTVIRQNRFNWASFIGDPDLIPDVTGDLALHTAPASPADIVATVNRDGTGAPTVSTGSITPISFTMPETYPVTGGIIADGTVILEFKTPGSNIVTCTYKGGSATPSPTTPDELNAGRMLHFVSCSDGLEPGNPLEGSDFILTVNPAPGYPVSVSAPIERDGYCSDEMEILSAEETYSLRTRFDWFAQKPVAERNPDETHALYYAYVYIRNLEELAALRAFYVHILKRPLFDEELEKYAGSCGAFTNPGDGEGVFIPVIIPGIVYNRLISALTSDAIEGDRIVFDAVIIRDVPAAARNSNGSIRYDVLANAEFQYLDYEPRPLPAANELQLDSGVAKVFVDVLTFVGEGLRDVGQAITNGLAKIDKLFRSRVTMTLHLHAINNDIAFAGPVMVRGWGAYSGKALAANDIEVSILQKLFDLPIPTTSQGHTDMTGRTEIQAVMNGNRRGSGICIELKSKAARITDFLVATHICDLRGYNPAVNQTVGDFALSDFSKRSEIEVLIDNPRLTGLYQADDLFQYSEKVMGYSPRRARILSGFFAETFSKKENGKERLYAPCLGFANLAEATGIVGFVEVFLSTLVPTNGLLTLAVSTFTATFGSTDIVMATNSSVKTNREVMSHEYGHYLFCSALHEYNLAAVDHIVLSTIAAGNDKSNPLRYTNEAIADYFTGQVAGGANYLWIKNAVNNRFCFGKPGCWDYNHRGVPKNKNDRQGIARIATLIHDAFDGQITSPTDLVPGNGDIWVKNAKNKLVYDLTASPASRNYGNNDAMLDRVALPASAFLTLAEELAGSLGPFGLGESITDHIFYNSLANTLRSEGVNWCDQCKLFALHSTISPKGVSNVKESFETCKADTLISDAIGSPPEPSLRIEDSSCTPCPPQYTSNINGQCDFCPNVVNGNTCTTCPADVVLDGRATRGQGGFDTSASVNGDICPDTFIVEFQNPQALLKSQDWRGFFVYWSPLPNTKSVCESVPREASLFFQTPAGYDLQSTFRSTGKWILPTSSFFFGSYCSTEFSFGLSRNNIPASGSIRFSTPSDSNTILHIDSQVVNP